MSMNEVAMLLAKSPNMSLDDCWLHLYVMLSRARTLHGLQLYGLPSQEVFERGPPAWITECLKHLEARAS